MENKFKVGDWLISDAGTKPRARVVLMITDSGYMVDLLNKSYYSFDCKCLRLALNHEIPLEYRKKQYYFY